MFWKFQEIEYIELMMSKIMEQFIIVLTFYENPERYCDTTLFSLTRTFYVF